MADRLKAILLIEPSGPSSQRSYTEKASQRGYASDRRMARRLEEAEAARVKYEKAGENTLIPAYSEVDPSAANHAPARSFTYYLDPARGGVPEWKNELAVSSRARIGSSHRMNGDAALSGVSNREDYLHGLG